MMETVDVKQLALARDAPPASAARRRAWSRYAVPGALVAGFVALAAWASRDALLPPREVWVTPVLASQAMAHDAGAPLFQAAGWIEPRPTPVRVAALAPGVVEQLLVVQDQAVKAGEPVAEMVRADAQLAHDREAANLRLREAEMQEMRAALKAATTRLQQPVHLDAALGEAEALLAEVATSIQNLPYETRRAEAQRGFAEANYAGKQSSEGAVSVRTVQEAGSALESARATVAELESRAGSLAAQHAALVQRRDALRTLRELLAEETQAKETAEANIAAAAARVEQARVKLAEASLRLSRMTVTAPVAGRVYQLVAFPGTNIIGGMSPVANADGSTIVTLYQPESLQVRVDVRFEDLPKLSLGQPVRINNPALAAAVPGRVLLISSEANIQKNTLQVKVALDDPQPMLKPEMLVDVTFLAPERREPAPLAEAPMKVFAPAELIHADGAESFAWLADRSRGVAVRRPVTRGGSLPGGLVEIASGLAPGDRLVSRGGEGLRDGQRIRIAGEEAGVMEHASAPVEGPAEPSHSE